MPVRIFWDTQNKSEALKEYLLNFVIIWENLRLQNYQPNSKKKDNQIKIFTR